MKGKGATYCISDNGIGDGTSSLGANGDGATAVGVVAPGWTEGDDEVGVLSDMIVSVGSLEGERV